MIPLGGHFDVVFEPGDAIAEVSFEARRGGEPPYVIMGVPTPSRTLTRIPEVGQRKKVGEERRETREGKKGGD